MPIPPLDFSNFGQSPASPNLHPQCTFWCLVSLAEWVIAPHVMCYFTKWCYESTNVEPWYLSARRPMLCVLYKASSLLTSDRCFFDWYYTHKQRQKYTQEGIDVLTAAICIKLNNLLISKIYSTECYSGFAFQKLLTCKSHISVDKIQ